MLTIYTDGSVQPTNPGPGGYGVFFEDDKGMTLEVKGYLGEYVTNNQCEYMGILVALDQLLEWARDYHEVLGDPVVEIYSDSMLAVNQLNHEWSVGDAKIRTLWTAAQEKIIDIKDLNVDVIFMHVPGHSGIVGNEIADRLANEAIKEQVWADERYTYLIDKSRKATHKTKGYIRLRELVWSALADKGFPTTEYPVIDDDKVRKALHSSGRKRAQSLLRGPHLVTVTPNLGPILLATQTSFVINSKQGHRVVTEDMWAALRLLVVAGHHVYIVHKPFGNGTWRTYEDLRWPGTKEIPACIAKLPDIKPTSVVAPAGWSAAVGLEADWQDFYEWLETA